MENVGWGVERDEGEEKEGALGWRWVVGLRGGGEGGKSRKWEEKDKCSFEKMIICSLDWGLGEVLG